jgi:enoyl-CoA hydratase/carnithine racemase
LKDVATLIPVSYTTGWPVEYRDAISSARSRQDVRFRRYAVAESKLSTAVARRGLAAERSVSWLLPRIIGFGAASELKLSGRAILAEELKV